MEQKLIRRVPQSALFEDSPTFYRIRESAGSEQMAEQDNSWSKVWGSQRPGRAKLGEQGLARREDPSFKLILRGLCLQWTSEIREIMRDWQVLFTLATRSHVSRRYPVVNCSSSEPAGSLVLPAVVEEEVGASPPAPQRASSPPQMQESDAGMSLVEHLIKSSMMQTTTYVESSQGKEGERAFTSILTSPRGQEGSTTSNIVSSITLLKNKVPKRCDVKWIVQFLDAQLGVETAELAGPGSGAERVIVHAESGTMKLLYFDFSSELGRAGRERKSDTEIRLLEMSNLQAFVVARDRDLSASPSKAEPSSIQERWGTTVWKTKEQGAELLQHVLTIEGLDERGRPDPTGTAMSLSLSKAVTDLIGSQTQANAPRDAAGEQAGSEVEVLFFNLKLATDTSELPPLLNCLKDMMTPVSADKFMAEETRNMRHMVQLMPQVALDLEKMKEDQVRYPPLPPLSSDPSSSPAEPPARDREPAEPVCRHREAPAEHGGGGARSGQRAPSDLEAAGEGKERAGEPAGGEERGVRAGVQEDHCVDDGVGGVGAEGQDREDHTSGQEGVVADRAEGEEDSKPVDQRREVLAAQQRRAGRPHRLHVPTLLAPDRELARGPGDPPAPSTSSNHTTTTSSSSYLSNLSSISSTFSSSPPSPPPAHVTLLAQWNADFRQVLGPLYSKDDFNFVDDKFFNRSDSAMLSVHAEQLAKPEGDQVVFSLFSVEIYPIKIQITEVPLLPPSSFLPPLPRSISSSPPPLFSSSPPPSLLSPYALSGPLQRHLHLLLPWQVEGQPGGARVGA
eukprot:81710-Hanusia_phi.AAC.2